MKRYPRRRVILHMAKDMDNPDDARELEFVDGEPVPVEKDDDQEDDDDA